MTDDDALPTAPSPETLRASVVYMQRDIKQLRLDLAENGRLDAEDRQLLARLDERAGQILQRMDQNVLTQVGDFFARLFGLGDNARRPWTWLVLLALFALAALGYSARETYLNADVREERLEANRRAFRRDSVERARAFELQRLRLQREIAEEQSGPTP